MSDAPKAFQLGKFEEVARQLEADGDPERLKGRVRIDREA